MQLISETFRPVSGMTRNRNLQVIWWLACKGYPGIFESEAHAFVSDDGDVTARLEQSVDLLITQKLIMEPYAEVNLTAQDIPELQMGGGIANYEIGLQTRYEFSRKFAPYIDLNYIQLVG
jgi:copper resistance protein B